MESYKFLSKGAKTFSVVTSVIFSIAILILVVIGLIGGNFLSISVIGSSVILFFTCIFVGAMQIKVFNDYKSQKKYLCADGIFYICLTILVAIVAMLFVTIQNSNIDIRYFIFVFTLAFAVWKIIISILAFKNKYFNAFAELLIALLWLATGIGVLLTIFNDLESIGQYVLCVSNYLLCLLTIFYILYSYVFKNPDYLITEKAIELFEKEEQERQQRLNRFNNVYVAQNNTSNNDSKSNDVELKLKKLQDLKEKGFINDEEYEKRKKEILDIEF